MSASQQEELLHSSSGSSSQVELIFRDPAGSGNLPCKEVRVLFSLGRRCPQMVPMCSPLHGGGPQKAAFSFSSRVPLGIPDLHSDPLLYVKGYQREGKPHRWTAGRSAKGTSGLATVPHGSPCRFNDLTSRWAIFGGKRVCSRPVDSWSPAED